MALTAAATSLRCSVRRLLSSACIQERSVSSRMNISHACIQQQGRRGAGQPGRVEEQVNMGGKGGAAGGMAGTQGHWVQQRSWVQQMLGKLSKAEHRGTLASSAGALDQRHRLVLRRVAGARPH